ncbi:hypothetical protein GCK32_015239 [Trichostrongylus colubriformis]|uniref:Uncharacterized protein n=1 Tax=Trichostrongylus colubriformis TaxID=6319 RepID=A0AAN8FN30_TRICO
MCTVDGSFNLPCYGTEASASYEYLSFSSTALCASGTKFSKNSNCGDAFVDNRSRMIARRLLQICDEFEKEFCQPPSCKSSWATLIWRFFI